MYVCVVISIQWMWRTFSRRKYVLEHPVYVRTYTRCLYRNWPTEQGNLKRSSSDGWRSPLLSNTQKPSGHNSTYQLLQYVRALTLPIDTRICFVRFWKSTLVIFLYNIHWLVSLNYGPETAFYDWSIPSVLAAIKIWSNISEEPRQTLPDF
jgi:hypothetical protein